VIVTLAADGAFDRVSLADLTDSNMTVATPAQDPVGGADISNGGPDDVRAGQLIMLEKGTQTALVQVTDLDDDQTVFFEEDDSLNLNQPNAAEGSISTILATEPIDDPADIPLPTTATRIRMIAYYIDATTTPDRPRLVRRMNNGDPLDFSNALGTTVAFDIENLQITYDISDGATNPTGVEMNADDIAGTGACDPNPCTATQIRKINIVLTGRSRDRFEPTRQYFRNSLASQVSLRSLAFVDRYN
jgi:hypothetical protein